MASLAQYSSTLHARRAAAPERPVEAQPCLRVRLVGAVIYATVLALVVVAALLQPG